MTTAAALRAEGEARGVAKGLATGIARGKLTLLQSLMKVPVTTEEELAGLEVAELERRFDELQRQYDAQFKRE